MRSRGSGLDEVERRRGTHAISLVPDGRTVAKLGVVLSILLVLVAVGIFLFAREVFNHIQVY